MIRTLYSDDSNEHSYESSICMRYLKLSNIFLKKACGILAIRYKIHTVCINITIVRTLDTFVDVFKSNLKTTKAQKSINLFLPRINK